VSFGARRELVRINLPQCELAGNSFTLGQKLTDKDFVSLEESELTHPRQLDRSPSVHQFLRPSAGSPLMDSGVNFDGSGPGAKLQIGALRH
jgi:hypothetical protein